MVSVVVEAFSVCGFDIVERTASIGSSVEDIIDTRVLLYQTNVVKRTEKAILHLSENKKTTNINP